MHTKRDSQIGSMRVNYEEGLEELERICSSVCLNERIFIREGIDSAKENR